MDINDKIMQNELFSDYTNQYNEMLEENESIKKILNSLILDYTTLKKEREFYDKELKEIIKVQSELSSKDNNIETTQTTSNLGKHLRDLKNIKSTIQEIKGHIRTLSYRERDLIQNISELSKSLIQQPKHLSEIIEKYDKRDYQNKRIEIEKQKLELEKEKLKSKIENDGDGLSFTGTISGLSYDDLIEIQTKQKNKIVDTTNDKE